MPRVANLQNQYSSNNLSSAYANSEKLAQFLFDVRGPENDFSGKYNVRLYEVENLFDKSWKTITTSSGHIKKQHTVTKVVINYKNHDNDPVDPGAVETLAGQLQKHINLFFENYLGYSTREKRKIEPDFKEISNRLNKQID